MREPPKRRETQAAKRTRTEVEQHEQEQQEQEQKKKLASCDFVLQKFEAILSIVVTYPYEADLKSSVQQIELKYQNNSKKIIQAKILIDGGQSFFFRRREKNVLGNQKVW